MGLPTNCDIDLRKQEELEVRDKLNINLRSSEAVEGTLRVPTSGI